MSLVINTNMTAIKTQHNVNQSYSDLANSIGKLSSGLRIEQSSDDAAGLAVREQMRANISTLDQSIRNAQDGISMIQTAESNLGVIDTKLTRMKELAEQASTGTYTDEQRLIVNSEFASVAAEIDRIASQTNFNGIRLLDGNVSVAGIANGAANNGGWTTGQTWNSDSGLYTNSSGWEEVNAKVVNEHYSGGIAIHFGTTSNRAEDYYFIRLGDVRTSSLFRGTGTDPTGQTTASDTISVSSQVAAQRALVQLDTAIARKDNMRASLGALQNRLEASVEGLTIQQQNLQASESRISDVDVASEMSKYVRAQILAQSGVSMMAQANIQSQMALDIIQ